MATGLDLLSHIIILVMSLLQNSCPTSKYSACAHVSVVQALKLPVNAAQASQTQPSKQVNRKSFV